eukprot:COSAG05_NODE_21129_length_274_cov_0.594286_1_plen_50_part_10
MQKRQDALEAWCSESSSEEGSSGEDSDDSDDSDSDNSESSGGFVEVQDIL